MSDLNLWLKTIEHVRYVSQVTVPSGSSHYLVGARRIKTSANTLGSSLNTVPYEGAYLCVCAEYELAVRSLLEDFASSVHLKVPNYNDLPDRIRKGHLENSALILTQLKKDKYNYVLPEDVVSRLHTCIDANSGTTGYRLFEEAFSYTWDNLRWKTVVELAKELDITNLIDKISTYSIMQRALGVTSPNLVIQMWPTELEQIMLTRNRVVHRTSNVASPTGADVKAAIRKLTAFITAFDGVLRTRFNAL